MTLMPFMSNRKVTATKEDIITILSNPSEEAPCEIHTFHPDTAAQLHAMGKASLINRFSSINGYFFGLQRSDRFLSNIKTMQCILSSLCGKDKSVSRRTYKKENVFTIYDSAALISPNLVSLELLYSVMPLLILFFIEVNKFANKAKANSVEGGSENAAISDNEIESKETTEDVELKPSVKTELEPDTDNVDAVKDA